MLVAANK